MRVVRLIKSSDGDLMMFNGIVDNVTFSKADFRIDEWPH